MAAIDAEVRDTLGRFLRAVESLDIERIAPFFEDDAQMFSPLSAYPRRLDGKAAIIEQFKTIVQLIRAAPQPIKIETSDLVVQDLGGNAALRTFHLKQLGPVHRRAFVMRRGAPGWRSAHPRVDGKPACLTNSPSALVGSECDQEQDREQDKAHDRVHRHKFLARCACGLIRECRNPAVQARMVEEQYG
ncbi:MAG: YybH family protein, partial [Candidatus Binataceae bacterium]